MTTTGFGRPASAKRGGQAISCGVSARCRFHRHAGRAGLLLSDDTKGKITAGLVAVGSNGLTPPF
jgi:hypothetical protein